VVGVAEKDTSHHHDAGDTESLCRTSGGRVADDGTGQRLVPMTPGRSCANSVRDLRHPGGTV